MASFVTDFTKTSPEILVDLLNADHGTKLQAEMLMFGTPVAMAEGFPRNTQLEIMGAPGSQFRGKATIHYNRVDLTTRVGTDNMEFVLGDAKRWRDMIPVINARLGINLGPDDYIDQAFNFGILQVGRLYLMASPNSLVYRGQLTVTFVPALPEGIPLSTVITDTFLNTQLG